MYYGGEMDISKLTVFLVRPPLRQVWIICTHNFLSIDKFQDFFFERVSVGLLYVSSKSNWIFCTFLSKMTKITILRNHHIQLNKVWMAWFIVDDDMCERWFKSVQEWFWLKAFKMTRFNKHLPKSVQLNFYIGFVGYFLESEERVTNTF